MKKKAIPLVLALFMTLAPVLDGQAHAWSGPGLKSSASEKTNKNVVSTINKTTKASQPTLQNKVAASSNISSKTTTASSSKPAIVTSGNNMATSAVELAKQMNQEFKSTGAVKEKSVSTVNVSKVVQADKNLQSSVERRDKAEANLSKTVTQIAELASEEPKVAEIMDIREKMQSALVAGDTATYNKLKEQEKQAKLDLKNTNKDNYYLLNRLNNKLVDQKNKLDDANKAVEKNAKDLEYQTARLYYDMARNLESAEKRGYDIDINVSSQKLELMGEKTWNNRGLLYSRNADDLNGTQTLIKEKDYSVYSNGTVKESEKLYGRQMGASAVSVISDNVVRIRNTDHAMNHISNRPVNKSANEVVVYEVVNGQMVPVTLKPAYVRNGEMYFNIDPNKQYVFTVVNRDIDGYWNKKGEWVRTFETGFNYSAYLVGKGGQGNRDDVIDPHVDPSPDPGYNPVPGPGYNPTPGPSYNPTPNPGNKPTPNPNPNPNPGYNPVPNPNPNPNPETPQIIKYGQPADLGKVKVRLIS